MGLVSKVNLVPTAGSPCLSCNTAAEHRAITVPDTRTVQNQEGCMHNPISFCSPSLETTDTATETDPSKTQILALLLFVTGQEKSVGLLGAFMSTFTRLFLLSMGSICAGFSTQKIRASLLLSVRSGVRLLALNWVSPKTHSYTLSAHPNTQQLESKTRFWNRAIFTVIK